MTSICGVLVLSFGFLPGFGLGVGLVAVVFWFVFVSWGFMAVLVVNPLLPFFLCCLLVCCVAFFLLFLWGFASYSCPVALVFPPCGPCQLWRCV